MYDAATIQELKQTNVSVDAEKSKQRVTEIWKSADKEAQDTILALAGVARSTIQRAYRTGNVSAKLIVPISQTLHVPPTYLSGETDEQEGYYEDQLKEFLKKLGYKSARSVQKPRGKNKAESGDTPLIETGEETAVKLMDEIPATSVEEATDPFPGNEQAAVPELLSNEAQAFMDTADEDTLILLMRSILVREKTGGRNAELAKKLKLLLFEIEN